MQSICVFVIAGGRAVLTVRIRCLALRFLKAHSHALQSTRISLNMYLCVHARKHARTNARTHSFTHAHTHAQIHSKPQT